MLGKTHVVGSLALVHVGLLAYSAYISHTHEDLSVEPLQVFDTQVNGPISLLEYGLVVTSVLFLVLLLLRVGKKRLFIGYAGLTILCMVNLYHLSDLYYLITLYLLSFTIGTLLPDIDSEDSSIGRCVPFISRIIPHRTYTHSIWIVVILVAIGQYLESVCVLALALGYTFHIVEDSFSKQGVSWFYPIGDAYRSLSGGGLSNRNRWFPFTYNTGGVVETAIFYVSIATHIICIGLVIWAQAQII